MVEERIFRKGSDIQTKRQKEGKQYRYVWKDK
jgi:hypothetical protein